MNDIRKRLRKLANDELRTVSKAIDRELRRRIAESETVADAAEEPAALPMESPALRKPPGLRKAA